jgi:hypothetical protein
MTSPRIFIVVLQYNNSQDTIRCLESLKELSWQDFRVIIVDNTSEIQHLNSIRLFVENQSHTKRGRTASPRGFVRDKGENGVKFHFLTNRQNLGYAGGNNIGIKYALKEGADYILVLNPDTTVESDLLAKLVETAKKNPRIGIIGAMIDEGDRVINCGGIKWLKPELKHSVLQTTNYKLQTNQYIPGVAMFVGKKVFEKIGFFDERYFLYFEDVDFCVRAQKAGFKLAVTPDTIIRHNPSSSASKLGAASLLYYHYRNAHLFNAKNAPFWIKVLLPFWSIWVIIKQAAKILLGRNTQISKAILRGVLDFYKGRFGKISNF